MLTTWRIGPVLLPALITVTCAAPVCAWDQQFGEAPQSFENAVVAADHPAASAAGAEILKRGGNVVDAAVAVAFTLSVVRPESCGIGGGGFMVIWNAERQEAIALDYRERAPVAASRGMFDPDVTPDPPSSRRGGAAVAVPGDVAGLCYALHEYGTLDLPTVLAPALRLAREGVPVDRQMLSSRKLILARLAGQAGATERYAALHSIYLNNGDPGEEGDRFDSPLADVLQRIADAGSEGFYEGPVADAIVAEVQRLGGLISHEDLNEMEPVVRVPLEGKFDGHVIITMPPPSSGGVALLQMLNTLSAFEEAHPDIKLESYGHNNPDYIHLVTEAMKHAFADRAEFLGDADFADVPVEDLIGHDYAAELATRIDMSSTGSRDFYGQHATPDDGGTSHFSIIDSAGNAVACTETINTAYGSLVVEPRFGIVLNNEMDDFAAVPGQPNAFGLLQSEANAIASRKKPLSSMTPTILVKDGKAVLAVGASGGPRIITATLQVLLNRIRFGMSVHEAVSAPRFHHQWVPEELRVENGIDQAAVDALRRKRHETKRISSLAAAQAATRDAGGLQGASDPRKGGRPSGY